MRLKHSAPCISFKGTPFIYQGQELGMTNFERGSIDEFDDISSIDQYYRAIKEGFTPKEALSLVNLRSRDNARTPFPWNDSMYGGFSSVKPWLEWWIIIKKSMPKQK